MLIFWRKIKKKKEGKQQERRKKIQSKTRVTSANIFFIFEIQPLIFFSLLSDFLLLLFNSLQTHAPTHIYRIQYLPLKIFFYFHFGIKLFERCLFSIQ
uniref:Uncharacterized protein n=1 Tax=Octopus bimaculoides TaxID=37653 RepID=A0A0L8FVR4_OCTBM